MNEDEKTDCIQVTLTRSPLHGFGIAISGGNDEIDNQSLIISDVIKNGPADGKVLPNDRIVHVNGHPVVRHMEYTALKLIRESTDFVNLIVQRRKHPVIVSDNDLPRKYIVNKTRKDEKFGIIIDCHYFIKKLHFNNNKNIHEGDEVIKINEIPIDRLTLQDAQKLIDKTKGQLILHTKPKQSLQSNYNQHIFQSEECLRPNTGTRFVSFFTETSSIGIRLAGGNKYGLFICEIQPNSVAYKSGLFIADKIFSVNNIDFMNLTREEAVLYLMNTKTSQVNMIVSNLPNEYEQLLADIGGDSFYIRTHFACHSSNDEELTISINDIFHITDTLYNGQVGFWVATKLNSLSPQNKLTGAIPNKSRAEQLVDVAPNLGELMKSKQMSLKRKLRSKFTDKRSRSVLSLNHFKDDSIFEKVPCWKPMINSKFPAYERVKLKSMTIIRPVVLLGSLADIARDRLLNQYPDQFESPEIHIQSPIKSHTNIIKLQSIKNVIQKNLHCLLDITPSAIEQLNYAECYPIVIYFKLSDRRMIKQIRHEYGKFYQKSSRRLFEISERLEHVHSYLFTSIIKLDSNINWFEILKSQIECQQEQPIWMSNERSIEKDFLKSDEYFISTNYLDEVSNPSNLDLFKKNYLQRVSSDPAMFPKEKTYFNRFSYNNEEEDNISMQTSTMSLPNRSHSAMEIPTTDKNSVLYQKSLPNRKTDHDHLFRADKYIIINQPKIVSINSLQTNESPVNRNTSRQPLIAPKLRTINSTDRLSSSDSNGSIRKYLFDKSTMSMAEKNAAVNLYATWTKPAVSRPTILPNNNFISHNENPSRHTMMNSNEKLCTESLLKQKMCSSKKYNHTSIPSDQSKYSSLQKPRVYTYDDRNLTNQQQNILSSSSGSSTISSKDKNIGEVGETRSYSMQNGCNVIGSARGIIDYYGGKLSCPLTGVSLFIPMGAIPEGIEQEIYFQVCQDSSHIEKFDGQLLSPIVICGPQGIQFDKAVELILPHSAGNDAQQLSLILHGTNQNSKTSFQQENQSFLINGIHHVTNSNVSILIDHF